VAILAKQPRKRNPNSPQFTATSRHWWHRLLGETRTRILLIYVVLMFLVAAASVPVFLTLLFTRVNERVQAELVQEMKEFRAVYSLWSSTSVRSDNDLRLFLDGYLMQQLPEDDNFLIAIVNSEFYKSNPMALPPTLSSGSPLFQRWSHIGRPVAGSEETSDPNIGNVLYQAQPLVLRGRIKGTFVVVHRTAGEQQEAIDGVTVFIQVAIGVVLISSIIAWFATAQILAPVKQLSAAARIISETDLTQRLPPIEGSGEMAELATTFNAMMTRLQEAFISQRDFINNAGHELRTPLTIIQGHLELMGTDPLEQQETLELVMDELQRMPHGQ